LHTTYSTCFRHYFQLLYYHNRHTMAAVAKLARSTSCPTVIAMTKTVFKRCGNCGVLGHNRRTCEVPEHYAAICHPCSPPSDNHKKCGNCGEMGHNRRTCTAPRVEKAAPSAAPKAKTFTSPQLLAQLPRYIPVKEKVSSKPLEGLKGIGIFRTARKSKNSKLITASEKRVAEQLAQLL